MFYSLDKLKLKTFFVVDISTLLYTLKRRTWKLFPLLNNVFLSPLFKVYKRNVKFSFTPTKNMLVFSFSFSFWFQFIQRIENSCQKEQLSSQHLISRYFWPLFSTIEIYLEVFTIIFVLGQDTFCNQFNFSADSLSIYILSFVSVHHFWCTPPWGKNFLVLAMFGF